MSDPSSTASPLQPDAAPRPFAVDPRVLLKRERERRGLSFRQLAGLTGVNYNQLHNLESGKRNFTQKVLTGLRRAFGDAWYWTLINALTPADPTGQDPEGLPDAATSGGEDPRAGPPQQLGVGTG